LSSGPRPELGKGKIEMIKLGSSTVDAAMMVHGLQRTVVKHSGVSW
jgi:hypothetical protein